MGNADRLIEEILRQRPDLSREDLLRLIDEKRRTVGAGYLSEAGACWLVAADLGVNLQPLDRGPMALKDLHLGASEISVVARILAIYPKKEYAKRNGSKGMYRRMVLYDGTTTTLLTLWEDKAELVEALGLKVGDIVKLERAYVKAGLDGRPGLHLGERGGLERMGGEEEWSSIPSLEEVAVSVEEVKEAQRELVVRGIVKGAPRRSEFEREDGSRGALIQFQLASLKGEEERRVVIWGKEGEESLLALGPNSEVIIVHLRSKLLPHGDLELHGDEATTIKVLRMLEAPPPPRSFRRYRLLSLGIRREREAGPYRVALLVDYQGRHKNLILRGRALDALEGVPPEAIVECSCREMKSGNLLCEDPDELRVIEGDDEALPRGDALLQKLGRLKGQEGPVMVQVIALTKSSIEEVTTRGGEVVKRGEVAIGDETGEANLVAWREGVELLQGIQPGERLRVRAAQPISRGEGPPQLQIKSYTSIERFTLANPARSP